MKSMVSSSNRGSALLIVLGLLSFLMISAVAFSISMRTERTAAAAYRRGLMARDLLDNAFVDARATVEHALRDQLSGFDADNLSTHTVERLAPFRYGNEDRYGRVMSSYDAGENDGIAYLLDDAVMRHVPPYIAYAVYSYLEQGEEVVSGDGYTEGSSPNYRLDTPAAWKPITVEIPEIDRVSFGENTNEATIGRMAWAVVNLSDSLDINALGSASTYRGIGLTANDFAFGTAGDNSNIDTYDLIDSSDDPKSSTIEDLPVFCSNADITRYMERAKNTSLVADNGNEYPYSWQSAVENQGDGFFSPFSCYSCWPHMTRKSEDGSKRVASSNSSSATVEKTISCDEVKESKIKDTGSELALDVQELVADSRYLGNDSAGQNFVRFLLDYIDKDDVPAPYDTSVVKELYANAQPTVEAVPMLSEVGYDARRWSEIKGEVEDLVRKQIKDVEMPSSVKKASDIKTTLKDMDFTLEIPAVPLELALRTYFPGESEESYDVQPEGFFAVTAVGALQNGGNPIEVDKKPDIVQLKTDSISVGKELFQDQKVDCTPSKAVQLKFKADSIPVTFDIPEEVSSNGVTPPPEQEVSFSFLADYFFRVDVKNGNDVVDRCPVDQGRGPDRGTKDYPSTYGDRLSDKMKYLDAQYFRVTCPLSVSFVLKWKLEATVSSQDNSKTTIEYKALEIVEGSLKVEIDFDQKLMMNTVEIASAGDDAALPYLSISAEKGTWFTVDPRYNWLSPMLGLANANADDYGTSEAVAQNRSSPHWLFVNGKDVSSGNDASRVQRDYQEKNADIVPFAWGLQIEDIRYSYNDTDQLLLPGEVGSLPIPLPTSTWHPNQYNYSQNSIASYYDNVAKRSFFRTIPIVDLKDGALSDNDYDRYADLCKCFANFGGGNFLEEHRGLVNVFAAQDNYYLAQRLRQFAMLGIPSSFKQAAKVSYDRLTAAEQLGKVPQSLVDSLSSTLGDVDVATLAKPKYDEFVTEYLFPLPSNGEDLESRNWTSEVELYKGHSGRPMRPETLDFIVQENGDDSFAARLMKYNESGSGEKLGQNDMTTLLSMAKECFGDRQHLFLYILRADTIAYTSGRELGSFRPLSTARAVALVWRDAYGELPDRVIYYQVLP